MAPLFTADMHCMAYLFHAFCNTYDAIFAELFFCIIAESEPRVARVKVQWDIKISVLSQTRLQIIQMHRTDGMKWTVISLRHHYWCISFSPIAVDEVASVTFVYLCCFMQRNYEANRRPVQTRGRARDASDINRRRNDSCRDPRMTAEHPDRRRSGWVAAPAKSSSFGPQVGCRPTPVYADHNKYWSPVKQTVVVLGLQRVGAAERKSVQDFSASVAAGWQFGPPVEPSRCREIWRCTTSSVGGAAAVHRWAGGRRWSSLRVRAVRRTLMNGHH